ncbi:MAG: hypothetical protein Q9184_007135, partial [Pyrenodesmia sp. 2 TL-2023]
CKKGGFLMDLGQRVNNSPVDILKKEYGYFVSLVIVKHDVKTIKQALETRDLLDKTLKIARCAPSSNESPPPGLDVQHVRRIFDAQRRNDPKRNAARSTWELTGHPDDHFPSSGSSATFEQKFVIPTTFEVNDTRHDDPVLAKRSQDALLSQIGLPHRAGVEAHLSFRRRPSALPDAHNRSLLAQVVRGWLHSIPLFAESQEQPHVDNLLKACNWPYTVYAPLLLLPSTFLSKPPWPELVKSHFETCDLLRTLYEMICERFKVTHIAIIGPIPALLPKVETQASSANVLRSPTQVVPLHGDFGEPNLPPTKENFQEAFWVTTVQNDITQTWAPLYTMFSRGNIREKTRLLKLASQPCALSETALLAQPEDISAVDLYAGIGYFAFSYAKAGINKVLCWELNGWSIEGLRRGAETNGWGTKTVQNAQADYPPGHVDQQQEAAHERLLIFHESNIHAAERIRALRDSIRPIRHVNCGYLPSSSDSWDVAVQILDPVEGGWIHAHENVAATSIEQRKCEVVEIFEDLRDQYRVPGITPSFRVECQHVEQVKAYAPGIIHCVFDIAILPISS